MTSNIVADASFVIDAWLDDSEKGAWSRELLSRSHAFVPELIFTEISRHLRDLEVEGFQGANDEFSRLMSAPWTVVPFSGYGRLVWRLRHDISMADAFYVALARGLKVPLVTLDLRMAKTAARYCEVITPEL